MIKNPPLNQLDEIKQLIAAKIDQGNAYVFVFPFENSLQFTTNFNRLLGLDLVVRDEHGSQLNPETTSTIEFFRAHEFAMKRIKSNMKSTDRNSGSNNACNAPNYIYSLLVSVRNFVCRIGDDADLIVALFDGRDMKFISENYLVKWGRDGLVKDLDLLDNLNVVFTVSNIFTLIIDRF